MMLRGTEPARRRTSASRSLRSPRSDNITPPTGSFGSAEPRTCSTTTGTLSRRPGPSGTTTYGWDSRNRLGSITTPEGQTTTFAYDFAGNLIRQEDSGPTLNLSKNYVLDDLTNVAFQWNSDSTQFSMLSGRSIDHQIAASNPPRSDTACRMRSAVRL